jgi:tetratricopeptide (TPR) repeat protein
MHTCVLVIILAQRGLVSTPEVAARVQVNEAVAHARAGRLAEALAALDASLLLDPFYAAAHHNRGVVLAMMGRHREALAALDRAVRLDPADTAARRARAAVARLLQARPVRGRPSARG